MNATMSAVSLLADARRNHKQIASLPKDCLPFNLDSAYDCQDGLIEQLLSEHGGHKIGYKIACTNKLAQQLVNLDGPIYGRLLSPFSYNSPAHLKEDNFNMRIIEPEFAFAIAKDLPSNTAPFEITDVLKVVGAVLPSIEIVDSHYVDWTRVGALSLIADNACNGGWVKGPLYEQWNSLDLALQSVELSVNGMVIRTGRGDAVMGNPLNALTWLANELAKRGEGLKSGDLVTTGITCDVYHAQAGDQIVASFGKIGSVEFSF